MFSCYLDTYLYALPPSPPPPQFDSYALSKWMSVMHTSAAAGGGIGRAEGCGPIHSCHVASLGSGRAGVDSCGGGLGLGGAALQSGVWCGASAPRKRARESHCLLVSRMHAVMTFTVTNHKFALITGKKSLIHLCKVRGVE